MRNAIRGCALMLAGVLTLASCTDSVAPPQPGVLTFSLSTPQTDDGIMLVTMKGAGLAAITPARSSYRVFSRQVDAGELRMIIQGQLAAGPLFSVQVPDTRSKTAYTATISEVAAVSNELRASLTGYSLTVLQ